MHIDTNIRDAEHTVRQRVATESLNLPSHKYEIISQSTNLSKGSENMKVNLRNGDIPLEFEMKKTLAPEDFSQLHTLLVR